jgi:hypothetical protein
MKMTLETARALQEQNRRRPERQGSERRERRKNSPTEKAKGRFCCKSHLAAVAESDSVTLMRTFARFGQ